MTLTLRILLSCSDLLIFAAFVLTPIIGAFIFKQGGFAKLQFTYPRLWRFGLASMGLCGLSRLIQAAEIWMSAQSVQVLDVTITCLTGIVALVFVRLFWLVRNEIIQIAKIIHRAIEIEESHLKGL